MCICHSLPGLRKVFLFLPLPSGCHLVLQKKPALTLESLHVVCCYPTPLQDFSQLGKNLVMPLNRPCVNATLHPERICYRLALVLPHRDQPTSSPNHQVRFKGHRRVSYTTHIWKLSLSCWVIQMSAQLMCLFTVSPNRVQAPCWPRETALMWKRSCSTLVTSSTNIDFRCVLDVFDQLTIF